MLLIGQVRGWAFAYLHLSRQDFYDMRPGEFWEAMHAHNAEKEADRMHLGELARGIAIRLFNTQVRKPVADVTSFWRMPWDPDKQDMENKEIARLNALSDEERDAEARKFIERLNNNGKGKESKG